MRMGKIAVGYGFLLLLVFQLGVRASTLFNKYTVQEMSSLKDLLERLEEKLSPGEESDVYAGSEDLVNDPEEDVDLILDNVRKQAEKEFYKPVGLREENLQRGRLRSIATSARSMNGCFGNRIERIGSWSSLGCNNSRFGSKKRIF
ncbi:ventricular natriuretic peptide isoform X1 [Acipenser ruthenus]|uniref:ventricular natriuretic peptide isoform X1 n=1 Tax=Acipenser ruthenus TaxID=7906 RepID=UPI00145BCB8E|nr:ventricular natriuretic peptide isoform X1 [Acipenser ruthenus]